MFNQTPQDIIPKTKPEEPCGMTIGNFPEEEEQEEEQDES